MLDFKKPKMRKRNMVKIPPDPAIMDSLLRTGYKWYQAMLDVIDNCIDALLDRLEADPTYPGKVFVKGLKNDDGRLSTILIGDTGPGMKADLLQEILALGKSAKRSSALSRPRLGVFGMGLKTASMALAADITIISREEGEDVFYVNWRPSEDAFSCEFDISEEHTRLFEEEIGAGSGTLVVFKDLRMSTSGHGELPLDRASFYRTLKRRAAHSYRHILNPNSLANFHTNFDFQIGSAGDETSDVPRDWDPLKIGHSATTILIGDAISGAFEKFVSPGGHIFWIRMVHHRRESGGDLSANRKKYDNIIGQYMPGNHYKQGVYWVRQGREIYCAPLWTPRQGISNIYAEVLFDDSGLSTEESPVQMDFGKTGIVIDPKVKEWLVESVFDPHVKDALNKIQKARKAAQDLGLDEITKKIADQVLTPNSEGNCQSPRTKAIRKAIKKATHKAGNAKSYRGQSLNLGGATNIQYDIEFRHWPGDIPFSFEDEGMRWICVINADHPFVKRAILDEFDKGNIQGSAYIIQTVAAIARSINEIGDIDERGEVLSLMGHLLNLYDQSFGERSDLLEADEVIFDDDL
jgi:hypothetical protein